MMLALTGIGWWCGIQSMAATSTVVISTDRDSAAASSKLPYRHRPT